MDAKDLFIDFINLLFLLFLIIFCLIYFVLWGNFAYFQEFFKFLIPITVFGGLFVAKLHLSKNIKKKREREGNLKIVLELEYRDKIKSEIIVFALPILILLVPFIIKKTVSTGNILQAAICFLLLYFWQKNIFDKEEQ